MACTPDRRLLLSARQAFHRNGRTVVQQRSNFRKEFLTRLRLIRNEKVDQFRQLCEPILPDEAAFESLRELQQTLTSSREAIKLMDSDELMYILTQVESDILQQEAERYWCESQKETESIAENLMNKCSICDTLIVEGSFCESCFKLHFNANF